MNRKIFFTRSFGITAASLAVTLLFQGMLFAQMPTTTSDVAVQAAKTLASEEVAQGIHVDLLDLKRTGGGSLTLKFVIVNDTKEQWNFLSLMPVSRVALLDLQNRKKY